MLDQLTQAALEEHAQRHNFPFSCVDLHVIVWINQLDERGRFKDESQE